MPIQSTKFLDQKVFYTIHEAMCTIKLVPFSSSLRIERYNKYTIAHVTRATIVGRN